ncbi:ankyrin repeat domain-containing protein [Wolbachia endosymbiont of Pentalonia nigronervosa]|jgi:ankyrin repeat protein|uniref:ankyrin repeat domain-containing protein n=1 Tax=Wolbachia endosymbiont of Pentalonia nigronervosa TaxID=1301914 RepID=UPI00165EDE94|nr:ankyrin repeat domain-containing protein [Wolbachia endosymbiont of Pentalonia nigronervosa]MBD0391627.1 ankyrin repeat domain-containing protein [Wolbachia endosymbiont of Pentalonia nigronervosa]
MSLGYIFLPLNSTFALVYLSFHFFSRHLLIAAGANVNAKGSSGEDTPLHHAAAFGRLDIVKALLAIEGIEVNAVDNAQATPLHYAAMWGHIKIVEALLAVKGIKVNAKDDKGKTPLHYAAMRGYIKIVEALLAVEGIEVNAKDHEGKTPLHYAAMRDHLKIVDALLEKKDIEVNAVDDEGNTPLYYAGRHSGSNTDIIRALVNKGAKIHIVEKPLHQDLAKKQRFKQIGAGAVAFCATAAFESWVLALMIAKGDFPVEPLAITLAVLTIAAVSLITGTIAYKAFEPRAQVNAADITNSSEDHIAL